MSKELSFSSPEPTGAIITQFHIAVKKCFEMKSGDCVYIETDGDVSIYNSENTQNNQQLEVKEYFEPLTDSHVNFWNTLNNWLNPLFNSSKYNQLIILTTQKIGSKSKFNNWNVSTAEIKLKIIKEIFANSKNRFQERQKNKESKIPDSLKLMQSIFEENEEENIKIVIEKIFIADSSPRRDLLPSQIIERELKLISEKNKNQALNSLLGFVIRKENYNIGWEISYPDFIQECQDINQRFKEESILFPINESFKETNTTEIEEKKNYPFAIKIQEINHEEDVIIEAITDYCFTIKTLMSEFSNRTSKLKSVKNYEDNLLRIFKTKHRSASNDCDTNRIINKSQKFYDEITGTPAQTFDVFNDTPIIYRNGVIHNLINEKNNLCWKLNPKTDE